MNAKMQKRIIFGSIMIAVMVGIFVLDARLDKYAGTIGKALPITALFVALIAPAFGEMKKFAAGAGVAILPVSGLLGSLALVTLPFWWQFAPAAASGESASRRATFPPTALDPAARARRPAHAP